jgi:hypothetical protein
MPAATDYDAKMRGKVQANLGADEAGNANGPTKIADPE